MTERPLGAAEESDLTALIRDSLKHPFALTYSYFEDRLPVQPNGKFEEFMCLVST